MPFDKEFHEHMMTLPDSMARAQYAVRTFPEKVVVFTGAGISAESGISPFRNATDDGEAIWDKYDPAILSSMDGFMENPALVWGWYIERLLKAQDAKPNAGHYALCYNDAPVITQNVDTLHEQAGSSKVIHLHGRGDKAKCTECDWHGEWVDLKRPEGSLPQCPKCGGLGRPDVVWFGEMLDVSVMLEAQQLLRLSLIHI